MFTFLSFDTLLQRSMIQTCLIHPDAPHLFGDLVIQAHRDRIKIHFIPAKVRLIQTVLL